MRRPLLALSLAAVLASPASAQLSSAFWDGLCSTGSFQACTSVSLRLHYDATLDRTSLVVGISNLQGLDGFPNPGRYYIGRVAFSGLDYVGPAFEIERFDLGLAPGVNTFAVGAAQLDGFVGEMTWRSNGSVAVFSQQGGSGIWGCAGPPPGPSTDAWRPTTCGGEIQVRYNFDGRWSAGANTTMTVTGGFAGEINGVRCTSGSSCAMVTPEPATVLLLATGLAGVVAIRRRRKAP